MRSAAKEKARAAWFQVGDAARLQLHHTPWWRHIYRDYRRYRAAGAPAVSAVLLSQGLWASSLYRISCAATRLPRWLRVLAAPVLALAQKLAEVVTGISIPPACEIGEGLYIGHFGPIIVDEKVRMGHNCNVGQSVTLARSGTGDALGAPTIGNRVFIGAHSLIVGKVVVGDDAMICAGSVVTRSVPARAVVLGNPARVISYEGSFGYVVYDRMEADAARQASISSTVLA